ncbi:protein SMG5-like [Amphibalanus amphitrite]|uniref:protein SMG5-like n=1 Tax=Amphibalanus amphitrite TaxID=1232801 RepID=UPI001C922361|nr:protein SMG5-like [Amphibalanus amphitrite]XP_043199325.1 protein SMG5-like [Amphibalanus amphitrite]
MKSILKNSCDSDGRKRSLSSAAELARRLDENLRKAGTVPEIFSPSNNVLRLRLRELCEHLLITDPEESGRRAEELLWRKVHYEPYSLAKQTGQTVPLGALDTALLASHLLAGLGSYQQLVTSLQTQLGVCADQRTDLPLCQPAGLTQETVTVRPSDAAGTVTDWGQAALQRILTNLGDLARYLSELRLGDYPPTLAARYYNQAVLLSPSVGRPHNQLGTLAGSATHGLQAAYHYLRCMTCDEPFDGGQVNLRKLLEKNHNRRVELEMEHGNSEVPARRRLIISFLDVIYGATLMEGAKQHRFVRLCQETLQWLSFCLHPPSDGGVVSINGQPLDGTALDSRTVLLMVVVVILALQTLKEDAAAASGLRAFLLAAFSCLVRTVSSRLTARFPALAAAAEPPAPAPAQRPGGGRERRGKRSRRRRAPDDDSEDEEEPPLLSQMTQLSQLSLPGLSDDSDSDSDSLCSAGSDSEGDERPGSAGGRPGAAELTAVLKDEGLLVPLRICCDWLRANEDVLRSCTESSAELWRHLVQLVNAVTTEVTTDTRVEGARGEFLRQLAAAPASLAQSTPLWEDRLLRGVHLLGTRHQHMDWNDPLRQTLSPPEEALLRVQLLVDFCSWLTLVPQLGVTQVAGRFVHTSSSSATGAAEHTNGALKDDQESGERRRQLMSNMAEQWLRSEVRSLRSRTARRGGQASFSPYVVVDTGALVHHLEQLKQMVKDRQFVVVVPNAVIHELDERKAGCSSSREASRWLEAQFRRGNRFLRPQRANEKASIEMVKYPRRKQREQWHFFQILECCNHLSRSVPAPDPGAPPSVTLLVAGEEAATGRDFSPRGLASAAGIHFELITAFHSKWALSSKGRS